MDPESRQVQGMYRLRALGVHFSIDLPGLTDEEVRSAIEATRR